MLFCGLFFGSCKVGNFLGINEQKSVASHTQNSRLKTSVFKYFQNSRILFGIDKGIIFKLMLMSAFEMYLLYAKVKL